MSIADLEKYKESGSFALDDVVQQKTLINEVFKEVMKPDIHYGVIPGTKKPSLYKPGAELITYMHRLSASYETEYRDFEDGHREVISTCTLTHIPTGQVWGQAVGSCTTMEGKYRFRTGNVNVTDKPVPQPYWDLRKKDPKAAQKMIGGPGHSTKKVDGVWMITEAGEKCEHDNPADYYNTVLKMAQKRAKTSATIEATAASDIFTVDVEDMPEVIPGAAEILNKETGEVVDVTPEPVKPTPKQEAPPQEDDSEADWAREEARIMAEEGGDKSASEEPPKNEYEDRPPPAGIKISKEKAKILYAKWKNIPDFDDKAKDEVLADLGIKSLYGVLESEYEDVKKKLQYYYK